MEIRRLFLGVLKVSDVPYAVIDCGKNKNLFFRILKIIPTTRVSENGKRAEVELVCL